VSHLEPDPAKTGGAGRSKTRRSVLRTGLLAGLIAASLVTPAAATEVLMRTNLGDIRIDLFEDETPITVDNFLTYLRDGGYDEGIIHRLDRDFVIQGGRDQIVDGTIVPIETLPPIQNEPGISNTRGTIAMAKRAGDPNSATSQWFFNLRDNTFLDSDNGGFTVFGEVVGNESFVTLDTINALTVVNAGQFFSQLPLVDWTNGEDIELDNFVVLSVEELSDFTINAGLNDAWFNPATDGQGVLVTVFPNLGSMFLAWFTFDTELPPSDATAVLGDAGHRWLTAQGPFDGNSASLSAVLTSGGVFDAAEPMPGTNASYGTIDIVFDDCATAELRYDFPDSGLSGVVPLQRVAADNISLCEALAAPAEE